MKAIIFVDERFRGKGIHVNEQLGINLNKLLVNWKNFKIHQTPGFNKNSRLTIIEFKK